MRKWPYYSRVLAFCAASTTAFAQQQQTSTQAATGSAVASATASLQAGGYLSSVPTGTASSTTITLTIGDAIGRALKANLGLLTSQETSAEVRAQRLAALSALLPKLNGAVSENVQQLNLATLGISFPGIPKVVGPFSYQSALVNGTVPIFNWNSIQSLRSSRENAKAASLSVKNAEDLVALAVGDSYLQIIADEARVTATQAEIDADQAVYNNAVFRHNAGTAIGIDVLRSEVQLKQRQQQLVAANNQLEKDKLSLARVIGLPIGQQFVLAKESAEVPLVPGTLEDALHRAYDDRPDYQAAKARVEAAKYMVRAARAQRYPTLTASGYYGDEGIHLFNDSHGVFTFQGSLNFNIFDGGRIRSDVQQNSAELRNRENELANLQGEIDYDVRTAFLDIKSAEDQVNVAKSNVQLADESLKESRDRFSAGVTNTVEVVQAQQAVADANENLISAQFQYNVAKVELATSLGLASDSLKNYFK